ncbi:integrase [Bradyrhizobium sp. USDA 10063]
MDIPTPEEIDLIFKAADGRWRPLLLVTIRCGLRASELRGLRWEDIDFKKGELHVRQRADAFNEIGRPKSEAGERTIPVPPKTLHALREWKLTCPRHDTGRKDTRGESIRELLYVFPNGSGNIENHSNIVKRGVIPTMIAAGVTAPVLDEAGKPLHDDDGKPVLTSKYSGTHALRHYFASWCINRAPVGLGLNLKEVQGRMGHSSITMTADRYGHLFPRGDDAAELAAAEGAHG